MSRRRRRKRPERSHPENKPINWSRLRQLFASFTCRRQPVLRDLVWSGIEVEASSPEELARKTLDAMAERARGEPES